MDHPTLTHLRLRADCGALEALRALIELCKTPNAWGYGPAQAYKYCLIAAFLGDQRSRLDAVDFFGQLAPGIEAAVYDEVVDWLDEKFDHEPDAGLHNWSPELLRLRFPISEVH